MKLSIIVPVYNVEKYVKECLDSIYDSNLDDFEVICIDDKGNDKSIEIIENYINEKEIENLKIIKHDQNKGLSESRNTGINIANGKYICFLDSDDMIVTESLNKLLDEAINYDLDIIEGNLKEIFETDINIESGTNKVKRNSTEILDGDTYFYYMCENLEYFPMSCCRIYKTEYIKEKYKFTPGLKFEDEEFSPRIIINAQKVKYSDLTFYIYRRRDNSITTNMIKSNDWVESYLKIIDKLTQFSETIKGKRSYQCLKDRISNFALSILKNPITYGSTEENLQEIINIVKTKKIYKIPKESKNIKIKIQGYIMKYPNIFIKLYKRRK